jgi:hypothetical protein
MIVRESIGKILKPKSEEEILSQLKDADPYEIFWNEDIDWRTLPIEKLPLIFQIWDDFSKRFPASIQRKLRGEDMGTFGKSVEFDAKLDGREIWVKDKFDSTGRNEVMFKIYPFKKIRKLKDIIIANNYMLENMDQYHTMINKIF